LYSKEIGIKKIEGSPLSKSVPHSVSYDAILIFLSVLPKGGPVITGGKQRYSLADLVNLNCTSTNSKPAADLFWSINGEPVSYLESISSTFYVRIFHTKVL